MSTTTKPTTRRRVKKTGPVFKVVEITPEVAREMLAGNTNNRRLRERIVKAFASDMRAGTWRENGETIKVSTEGTLIDGQHRLSAVIASETTQRMLVVTGLDMEVQETVDTGAKRLFADVLKLRGETDTANLAAACRQVCLWEHGIRGNHGGMTPTNTQLLDVLARYPDLRQSMRIAYQVHSHLPVYTSTLSLCHWLFSRIDGDDCDAFFEKLRTGAELPRTHAISALRRTFIDSMTSRSRLERTTATAYVIKAWNAYREGKPVGVYRYRQGGSNPEKFPEPI